MGKYITIAIYNHAVLPGLETKRGTPYAKSHVDSLERVVFVALTLTGEMKLNHTLC